MQNYQHLAQELEVLARVDGAVCGPMRAAHLDPILAARDLELSVDDVQRIGGLFE